MVTPVDSAWVWWADRLLAGSIQGGLAVLVVWLACRVLTLPPAMRAALWWMASLKLIAALIPLPTVALRLLPAPPSVALSDLAPLVSPSVIPVLPREAIVPSWLIVIIAVWSIGVLLHVIPLAIGLVRLARTVRDSTPVGPDDADAVRRLAARLGLRTSPDVRSSSHVSSPLVVGIVRPIVLLPSHEMSALSQPEREMAICHELAHIRRRDIVFGWIPALAERLFFFHPLARVAAREYAAEREAACDAIALQATGAEPAEYGRMLLRLGVVVATPAFTAGGSATSRSSLRRRLAMLHDSTSRPSRRGVIALVTMLAVVAFVPYRLTARTPVPGEQSAPASAQRPEPPTAPASGPRAQPPATPAASRPPRPVTPSKPSPAEEQQLSQAISDQRASMQQMEKALKALREQFHELLMQAEVARHAAELNDARISQAEAIRRAVEEQQSAQNTSRQLLAQRLEALMKEHEVTESRLRQLAAEIESVKQKLNEPF